MKTHNKTNKSELMKDSQEIVDKTGENVKGSEFKKKSSVGNSSKKAKENHTELEILD